MKREKHGCMFNSTFVFLSFSFIFHFSNKIKFTLEHWALLSLQGWVWNVSDGSERAFSSRWIFSYLSLFVVSQPTKELTNGDASKAFSKWHGRFSNPLHHNRPAMILGHCCHCVLLFCHSRLSDPSRHFAFTPGLLTPFPLSVLSPSVCLTPWAHLSLRRSDNRQWVSILNSMIITVGKGRMVQLCF